MIKTVARLRSQDDVTDIRALLFQLTRSWKRANQFSLERLKEMISGRAYIAIIREGATEKIIGMGTLVVADLCMERRAIIEDVVIHRHYRGKGLGKKVIRSLIVKARELKVSYIDLTSRPERIDARGLYQSMGFCERDTKVYRVRLDRSTS